MEICIEGLFGESKFSFSLLNKLKIIVFELFNLTLTFLDLEIPFCINF